MKKVLLIQPALMSLKAIKEAFEQRNFKSYSAKRINLPLGLLHIGSVLVKNNIETKILDLDRSLFYFINDNITGEKKLEKFFDKYLLGPIDEYGPDVIGISSNFNTNVTFVQRCYKESKRFFENTIIVLGGHYPTYSYKEILSKDWEVDYVVLGEGEEVMLDIINTMKGNTGLSLDDHPNVVTRSNVLNKTTMNKIAAMVADIESLPQIDYSILDNFEDYLSSQQDMRTIVKRKAPDRAIAMMTSRGCPFRCTYCSSHKVHGKMIRAFSIERIIKEIKDLVNEYDVNTIIFEDDLFTYSRKRTIDLCKNIYELFGDRFLIEFPNGIAVKTLKEEVISWMAKAGMKQIHLAIESGNQYVQDVVIKKRLKLDIVKPVVDLLKKHGVLVRAYFIIGFPDETIEMMRDTKDFAKKLKLDWAVFSFAAPVVGSELYESARISNQLVTDNLDTSTYSDVQLRSNYWKPEDVAMIQEEANIEVNFLGNYNLIEGNYEKSKLIYEDILSSYPKHLFANYCLWQSQIGLGDYTGAKRTEGKLHEIIEADQNSGAYLTRYNLLQKEPFSKFLTH